MGISNGALLRRFRKRKHLLKDEFGLPVAAGSMNATPAVPGPGGLRTVTDTTNLMRVGPWKTGTRLADETTMSATFGEANNRCSYYDGQAWVGFAGADFGNAGLTADRWYLLVMQDSSSKLAYCYVKGGDVGAGEVLATADAITGITKANPGVITFSAGHGLANKKLLKLSGLTEMTELNDKYVVILGNSGDTFQILSTASYGAAETTGGNCAQEVTAPAATCIYAYKSVNGSQGWHMDGTFNTNDSAYTYDIYELGETALVCAGRKSTAAWGDPGLWWPAVTRRLGLTMIVGPVTVVDCTSNAQFGFDANTAADMGGSFFYNSSDKFCPSGSSPNIYTPLDNTPYYLAIRLLAAGAEYYLRTATGYWKLLWRGGTNAAATLYPGISNYSAAFTLSKPGMQLLPAPWNPLCACYDSFTRSDGAVGSSEALDGLGVSAPIRAYTQVGTWAISSNALVCSALDSGVGMLLADIGTPDTITEINATIAAGTGGVVVRYVDADNYIRLIHDRTNVKLIKRVAGSETTTATVVTTYSAAAQVRLICDTTTFTLFYNGALVGTSYTINEAALNSATKVGVYTSDTGNSFDVLWASYRGTRNEFGSLDMYIR